MFSRIAVGVSLVLTNACQASAGAQLDAKNGASGDASASLQIADGQVAASNQPGQLPRGSAQSLTETETMAASAPAMLGARAGLRLVKTGGPTCQCLIVAVGNPQDAAFAWEGPVPTIDPLTQIVVGLTSQGLTCPAAAQDSLGASYRGYEVIGADVVIQVETTRRGRPIAHGAIVPRPTSGGRILLRSATPKSPYGQSFDGKSRTCVAWTAP